MSNRVPMLFRFFMTLIYTAVGLLIAFPLSYLFQDGIYNEMTWLEYVRGGFSSIKIGAEFGALDIYRYTVIGSLILAIAIGRWLEWRWRKKRH